MSSPRACFLPAPVQKGIFLQQYFSRFSRFFLCRLTVYKWQLNVCTNLYTPSAYKAHYKLGALRHSQMYLFLWFCQQHSKKKECAVCPEKKIFPVSSFIIQTVLMISFICAVEHERRFAGRKFLVRNMTKNIWKKKKMLYENDAKR